MPYHLYKTTSGPLLKHDNSLYSLPNHTLDTLINHPDLPSLLRSALSTPPAQISLSNLLPPLGTQEVWAAGVTYLRSRDARMDESKAVGGTSFYDRVYAADRPELFFKSTAHAVVAPNQPVRIRRDSTWNVPEPELTLVVSSSGKIVAYTIGNDMSSRDIEGQNPLYLPQAKTYDGSCALGPCLLVPDAPLPPETVIEIVISRNNEPVFTGSTTLSRMKRTPQELVSWLYKEHTFLTGAFLLTGTGIVPPDTFTLQSGDEISISIPPIGTLTNTVA